MFRRRIGSRPSVTEDELTQYFDRLWPIMRSLTGDGVRLTHDILAELLPLERTEVPSGTQVFDWKVPQEWVVREAYIINPDGHRILDIQDNTLHLVNYSAPYQGTLSRSDLDQHLYSLPDMPEAIPYVTSYYAPKWGFCLKHTDRLNLPDGDYQVFVDTDFIDGSMTYSEAVLPGDTDEEVFFSTYTCHPSMANNELSGPLVTALLYRHLAALESRRYTYRFVFLPETIGAIAYLSQHGDRLREKMLAGYVVTCIGDPAPFTYKYSRRGNTPADRAAEYVLRGLGPNKATFVPFVPSGSDERQYCSPGFNLPVGSIMRSMYKTYPEYHTSLDNREFTSFQAMLESAEVYANVCRAIEMNKSYRNLLPYGEPQLGKRGLYPELGASKDTDEFNMAVRWVLNLSDGDHDLLDISKQSGISLQVLNDAARQCLAKGLLEPIST